jgi:hypothetical protein
MHLRKEKDHSTDEHPQGRQQQQQQTAVAEAEP